MRRRGLTAILGLTLTLCCIAGVARAQERPNRIVSINLCADQYVLALVDPSRIAAVSRLARDPSLSFLVREARGVPAIAGAAEEVVRLDPDLVLTGAFTRRTTADLLRRFGFRVAAVPYAETIEDVRAGLMETARMLGVPSRGAALAAELDAALGVSSGAVEPVEPVEPAAMQADALTLLHYQARGFVTGSRTLLGELLALAGFDNLADDLGVPSLGRVGLEQVVAAVPDRLLVDGGSPADPGIGQALPDHPALTAMLPREGRIALPDALITCGGPATAAAFEFLKKRSGF